MKNQNKTARLATLNAVLGDKATERLGQFTSGCMVHTPSSFALTVMLYKYGKLVFSADYKSGFEDFSTDTQGLELLKASQELARTAYEKRKPTAFLRNSNPGGAYRKLTRVGETSRKKRKWTLVVGLKTPGGVYDHAGCEFLAQHWFEHFDPEMQLPPSFSELTSSTAAA